jgi:outer membrane biosynthesis protein TonB
MKLPWKNKDQRRGLLATLLFHGLLLLVFFFFGLTYLDPKPEDGVLINFGNSAAGLGDNPTPTQAAPQSTPPDPTEPVEETQDPVATQDVVEAPALKTEEKEQPKKPEEQKPQTTEKPPETTKEETENQDPPEEEAPQPSKNLQDLLKKTQSSKVGGEGNTQGNENMGDPSGQEDAGNRGGTGGGGGGGGNYRLGGRQALAKPRPDYPCDDAGRVVVKIQVNRDGEVIKAVPGERVPGGAGSTTASSCLYNQARRAAKKTTWQPKPDAPEYQIGYIIYNFSKQ